jgi:hypothetical protein
MVQLYCCVFTFIVFVGEEFLPLVPVHLPHLRVLGLDGCRNLDEEYINKLGAAIPEVLIIGGSGEPVGNWRYKIVLGLMDNNRLNTLGYVETRRWALKKNKITRLPMYVGPVSCKVS